MSRTVPTARDTHALGPLLDPKMLDLLVCPRTHGALVFDEARQELVSSKAKLAYPVRDGVPILLAAEARSLDEE